MQDQNTLYINTDGGARGNPGPAGIGVYAQDSAGICVFTIGKRIGETTNNIAEYTAVVSALTHLIDHPDILTRFATIQFRLDSELICNQINGVYKAKNEGLQKLLFLVREKEQKIPLPIGYTHVRREFNKAADKLVNAALDNLL